METIITIENDDDHKRAMDRISELMTSTSPEDLARLDAQAREVEAYEAVRWPRTPATKAEIDEYLLEQRSVESGDTAGQQ
ncbi:hypothetical protein [Capsulimonas corticalis]|nr:hypothetical protein [Capsulimonas corticalis]